MESRRLAGDGSEGKEGSLFRGGLSQEAVRNDTGFMPIGCTVLQASLSLVMGTWGLSYLCSGKRNQNFITAVNRSLGSPKKWMEAIIFCRYILVKDIYIVNLLLSYQDLRVHLNVNMSELTDVL